MYIPYHTLFLNRINIFKLTQRAIKSSVKKYASEMIQKQD